MGETRRELVMRFARNVRVLTLESKMASLLNGFSLAHSAGEASSSAVMADVSPRMFMFGSYQYVVADGGWCK
jgi:hypothetical protein